MTLKVDIQTIPHRFQRYDTLGDWAGNERHRMVFVSEMANNDYEFLVALHELIEHALCLKRNITDEEVCKFDMNFTGDGEPGDQPDAPYHKEHQFANKIEQLVTQELGIDSEEYEQFLEDFYTRTPYE